jgi:hypothetical protein
VDNVANLSLGVSHSVGWGKKETQFHGSEGKAAAQKKVDVNKYTTSADDDHQPRISWRGDGSFYVVSSVDMSKGKHGPYFVHATPYVIDTHSILYTQRFACSSCL